MTTAASGTPSGRPRSGHTFPGGVTPGEGGLLVRTGTTPEREEQGPGAGPPCPSREQVRPGGSGQAGGWRLRNQHGHPPGKPAQDLRFPDRPTGQLPAGLTCPDSLRKPHQLGWVRAGWQWAGFSRTRACCSLPPALPTPPNHHVPLTSQLGHFQHRVRWLYQLMERENVIKHCISDETSECNKSCFCDNQVDTLKRLNNRIIFLKCVLELSVREM